MNEVQTQITKLELKGWTLASIADEVGVSTSGAEKWKNGHRYPENAKAILHLLNQLEKRKRIPKQRRYNRATELDSIRLANFIHESPSRYMPRNAQAYFCMDRQMLVLGNVNDYPLEHFTLAKNPRLLDLFCCAGGAGVGYNEAGFDVIGIDINPQPNYPLPFIQADVLTLDPQFIATFDAVHASPPCQSYSDLAKRNGNAEKWPRLIEPVRELLVASGIPFVIENVEGAPLIDPIVLCGTMFPELRVLRHRLFETNFPISAPPHGPHPKVHTFDKRKSHFGKTNEWEDFVQVTGGGNCSIAAARHAMGITWMTKREINEAIPPAYTRFIGKHLLAHIKNEAQQMEGVYVNA
jgi:DNA (cytosine-5)-methyltransferase 1